MEIPLLFSIDKPSVMAEPLSTLPRDLVAPEWCSRLSVIEVFPASTWAKIPIVKTVLLGIYLGGRAYLLEEVCFLRLLYFLFGTLILFMRITACIKFSCRLSNITLFGMNYKHPELATLYKNFNCEKRFTISVNVRLFKKILVNKCLNILIPLFSNFLTTIIQ